MTVPGVLVVLEDSPGRLDRMRAETTLPIRSFHRAAELVAWLATTDERVVLLTLDYHLASRADGTGLDVARALSGQAPRCPVIVHSSDTTAAAAVAEVLTDAGWVVERVPFESGRWSAAVERLAGGERVARFAPARITERIFQNGYVTEREAAVLQGLGVTHLLNLDLPYGSTGIVMPAALKVVELLLHDMAPLSQEDARRVVAIIQHALDLEGGRIYVHCNAGLSRSPTAVWLYLVASGWGRDEASATIAAAATHLDAPDPILVHELDLAALTRTFRDPRWELWRQGEKTHPNLLTIHATEAEAAAERERLEAKQRAFAARGFRARVRYWVAAVRPS